jgi:hypothetical protein
LLPDVLDGHEELAVPAAYGKEQLELVSSRLELAVPGHGSDGNGWSVKEMEQLRFG